MKTEWNLKQFRKGLQSQMQTNRGNDTKIELTYLSISLQVYLLTLMSWSVGCLRPSIMLCSVGMPTFNRPASSSISAIDQKNENYRSQRGTLANLENIMGNHEQVSRNLRASCSRKLVNAFHQAMLTSVGVKKPTTTNRQSCHATDQEVHMQKCRSCYFLGASTTLYKQVCIVISMYLCSIGTIKSPSPRTTKKKGKKDRLVAGIL